MVLVVCDLVLATGAFLVVSSNLSGGSAVLASTDLKKAGRIRFEVYREIDVAADKYFLIDLDWHASSQEILSQFRNDSGGVWCSGAAQTLATVYSEMGLRAYILSYGFIDHFTHAVVLVQIGDEFFIQDPYLNYQFDLPLRDIIRLIAKGTLPPYRQGPTFYRDVHLRPGNEVVSWAVDRKEPTASCELVKTDHLICRANHTAQYFERNYKKPGLQKAIDMAASYGFAKDARSLLLFPYGLSGPDGWVDTPTSELHQGFFGKLISEIREATEGRFDPAVLFPENEIR